VIYLNRLSDLLFVLARVANDQGRTDVLWEPGRGQGAGLSARDAADVPKTRRIERPPDA
jgi:hypothetical protein